MLNSELLRHPKGLYFLAFTEMWEKFSYFGMRSLLVYYMTKHLVLSQSQASLIYGFYTGLVYFVPIVGGVLGDRFWGRQNSIIIGSILMIMGHFLMMLNALFYFALIFLVLGSGIFIPNISPQISSLYQAGDHRRSRAFNIVYLGVNIGATFSPLICGTVGEIYGWHYGFGIAGIGMVIGLIAYLYGRRHLPNRETVQKKSFSCCVCENNKTEKSKNDKQENSTIKKKLIGFLILVILGVLFRAVYNQQGNTLALWVDSYTNRYILGWEMPASWFQAFNPFMVILFTPVIIQFWNWQEKHKGEPSNIIKMGLGCIMLGISFLLLVPAASIFSAFGEVGVLWPIACIFVLTVGEVYFCPVAVSLITKNAPAKMGSIMVALWYQSYFLGNCLSGFIGRFFELVPKELFFLMLSITALIAGLGMFVLDRFFKSGINYL